MESEKVTPTSDRQSNDRVLYGLVVIGLKLRLLNIIAVASSFLGALCMSLLGLIKTTKAILLFFQEDIMEEKFASTVTSYVVQAMDAFLIAMVLVVFSTGIFHLFIKELKEEDFHGLRGFKRVTSIHGLKKILGELIIVVLFVHFLKLGIEGTTLDWKILVIPIGALLMAAALRLLNLDDANEKQS